MFIYSTFFTLKHYPDKGGFYYPYFSFYTLWFVAGPCIIIIANHIIAEWVRQKVSQAVYFFAIFLPCTQICFCALPLDFMQHPIQGRRKVSKSRPLEGEYFLIFLTKYEKRSLPKLLLVPTVLQLISNLCSYIHGKIQK